MALTDLAITKLKPKDKLYRVCDGEGLYIEVTPAGGKLWRWRYRHNGIPQMSALGKYPQVSLKDARKRRDEARVANDSGKHPTRVKAAQKLRAMHEGANTFEVIARRWITEKGTRLNPKYHKQSLIRMEQHVFPVIGALPITEIRISDVAAVVEKIAKRGTIETAKRMGQLISQTFRYACRRGLCDYNPATDLRDIVAAAPEKHHASVTAAELPELLKAISVYKGDALTKAAMNLMSFTFVRTQELIGARWEEINWQCEEWHIPASRMKMRRSHMVPLSSQALNILKELRSLTGDKEFIFYSSRSKSKHISNGSILMALRRMGYKGQMTGHGFRSIASTILNEKGYNPDWIEKQLAHGDNDKIRSAYNNAEYTLKRKKMMQDYANFLSHMVVHDTGDHVASILRSNRAA